MRARHAHFRPFTVSGHKTIAAIMLAFALYTALSLMLSSGTATRSTDQADVLQIAARQRTLTERYTADVLLGLAGLPSAAVPIAHDLEQSGAALLDGGVAPGVAGWYHDVRIPALTGKLARLQLRQELSLIHDLVATGNELLAGGARPLSLTAHERLPVTMPPLQRLTILTGITSNVALNVEHSIGAATDRTHLDARIPAASARRPRPDRVRATELGARDEHAATQRALPEPRDLDHRSRARLLGRALQVREQLRAAPARLHRGRRVG